MGEPEVDHASRCPATTSTSPSGAAGYYAYFDQKAPGYYAWNAGTWRIYDLNSNCDKIDCEAEEAWLRKDLDDHPHRCTIVAMHHPPLVLGPRARQQRRRSAGSGGSPTTTGSTWRWPATTTTTSASRG